MSDTYLSGFCSGGAEWAHARCPAAWQDKPCRCACHQAVLAEHVELAEVAARPRPTVDLELG